MNVSTDPLILKKLEDFRVRRRNLILLRGLCTGFVTLCITFSAIALIDFATQARIPDDLRTGLSIFGYIIVIASIWKTSARMLVHLPSHRELARLIEQTKPEMKQDILSAVELGSQEGQNNDSEKFRKLVQEKVSGQVHSLDIISLLPFAKVKRWLQASFALIVLCLGLFSFTDFGPKFQQLIERALLPGSNIAPVTNIEVTLLNPDDNITVTPKNEPLRFLAELKGKVGDKGYGEVELQVRESKNYKKFPMFTRTVERFSLDYNVESNPFDYRVWVAGSPRTAWQHMDVASRPHIVGFSKTYHFPEYTKLPSQTIKEKNGHLSAWEGTRAELELTLSQPVSSGSLFIDWTGKKADSISLVISENGLSLTGSLVLNQSGTYRAIEFIDRHIGWKGKPSPRYEINTRIDLAPSIRWLPEQENALLLAPEDILSLEAWAEDDLGLERIEFHFRTNKGKWKKFLIPGNNNPKGKNRFPVGFDIDLLSLKPKPGDQGFLKLVAFDLKGSSSETEPIQISFVSRSFDLSPLNTLKQKNRGMEIWEEVANKNRSMAKEFQELTREKNAQNELLDSSKESIEKMNNEFSEIENLAFQELLQILTSMPKGTDAQEISMLTQGMGKLAKTARPQAKMIIRSIQNPSNNLKENKKDLTKLSHHLNQNTVGLSGNLRNIYRDLQDQHVITLAASYLHQLNSQQMELKKMAHENHSPTFLKRRQQIALHQWDAILKVLSYQKSGVPSSIKKLSREQGNLLESLEHISEKKDAFAQRVDQWSKIVERTYLEIKRDLVKHADHSFSQHRTNLFNNLGYSWGSLGELSVDWENFEEESEKNDFLRNSLNEKILVNIQTLIMRSEVEHFKKDSVAGFVKDAGQASRALIELKQKFNHSIDKTEDENDNLARTCLLISDSFRKLEMYHLILQAANQAVYFTNLEKRSHRGSIASGERSRQWAMVQSFWEPSSNFLQKGKFAKEAIEILKSLKGKSYVKDISKEMKKRIDKSDHSFSSMDQEGELIIAQLEQVLLLLKPEASQARKIINELAPTLAELARALAKETRLRKENAEEIKDKNDSSVAETRQESTKMEAKQILLEQNIDTFTRALKQEAGIQNLLDKEGREIARDSDDASALVQTRKQEVRKTLTEVLQARTKEEQKEILEKTVIKQEELAETFELIAEHFENVEIKKETSQTREQLRNVEKELGIEEEIEKQFAQAEKLAELAKLPPEALLKELEKELSKNKPMQEELTNISKETIEDVKEVLEKAKNEEVQIAKELENSDQELAKKKAELAKQLEQVAKESSNLAKNQIKQTAQKSEEALAKESSDQIKEIQQELEDVARKSIDKAKPANTSQTIKEQALELAKSLSNVQKVLKDTGADISELANQSLDQVKNDATIAESKLDETRQELSNQEQKEKDLSQEAEEARKKTAEANALAVQAKEEQQFKEKNAEQVKNDASLQPDNQAAQKETQDANAQAKEAQENADQLLALAKNAQDDEKLINNKLEQAIIETEARRKNTEKSEEIAKASEERAQILANPQEQKKVQSAAKQANQKAEEASKLAAKLEKKAADIAEALKDLENDGETPKEELVKAMDQQESIAEEVFDSSEDLARTARHEDRLENEEAAEEIMEIAEKTKSLSEKEIPETAQALQNKALSNELQNLAEEAQKLASKSDNKEASENLEETADQTLASLDEDTSLAQIKDTADQFAQDVKQAAEAFANDADKASNNQKKAQQQADNQSQQAQVANQQAKEAKQKADSLAKEAQKAKNLAQLAQNDAQEASDTAGLDPNDAKAQESAQLAKSESETALSNAQKADQEVEVAKKSQQSLDQAASNAEQESQKMQTELGKAEKDAELKKQIAEAATELAQSANEFLESLPDDPVFSDLVEEGQSNASPGEALANTVNALEEEIAALSNLDSDFEESSNTSSPISTDSAEEMALTNITDPSEIKSAPTTPLAQNGPELESDPSSRDESSHDQGTETLLNSPEIGQALAQTLDFLDQALNTTGNPFTQEEELNPNVPGDGQPTDDIAGKEGDPQLGEPGEPGKPIPGHGPGNGRGGSQSGYPGLSHSSAQAMTEAARVLAEASKVQAQAMAQARAPIQNSLNLQNSPQSNDGAYMEEDDLSFQKIPELNGEEFEQWGKLPPKLAKDLMEAPRENVAGDYRNRVEAYFQAMASKARKIK